MTTETVFDDLALDSAEASGLSSEVSRALELSGTNAIQGLLVVYALTATNVSFQCQVSNDLVNWENEGTAQTATTIGRKLLTSCTAIAARYVRFELSITGTGIAIARLDVHVSEQ